MEYRCYRHHLEGNEMITLEMIERIRIKRQVIECQFLACHNVLASGALSKTDFAEYAINYTDWKFIDHDWCCPECAKKGGMN